MRHLRLRKSRKRRRRSERDRDRERSAEKEEEEAQARAKTDTSSSQSSVILPVSHRSSGIVRQKEKLSTKFQISGARCSSSSRTSPCHTSLPMVPR